MGERFVCRYLSFVALCRELNSRHTASRALRAVSRETPYRGARSFSSMLLNSATVSRPCRISSFMAFLTPSNFFGLGPRGRLKRVSTGLLEAAFGIGMVPPGAKWFAGLGEAAKASVHHDGGGSSCRRAKSSAASFITTIRSKKKGNVSLKGMRSRTWWPSRKLARPSGLINRSPSRRPLGERPRIVQPFVDYVLKQQMHQILLELLRILLCFRDFGCPGAR
jgi:hypothetical protein